MKVQFGKASRGPTKTKIKKVHSLKELKNEDDATGL